LVRVDFEVGVELEDVVENVVLPIVDFGEYLP
jgi:hypothetical protein